MIFIIYGTNRFADASSARFDRWNKAGDFGLSVIAPVENSDEKFLLCTAVMGLVFSSVAAEAKGCIKGAIIGGIAGHYAGHGKVGMVAGCVIGRHEANKADAERAQKAQQQSPRRDDHI